MHSFILISKEAASYSLTLLFLNVCSAVLTCFGALMKRKSKGRKRGALSKGKKKLCAVTDAAEVARKKYSLLDKASKVRSVHLPSCATGLWCIYWASHLLHPLKENNSINLTQDSIKINDWTSKNALRSWNGSYHETQCHCFPQSIIQMNFNGNRYVYCLCVVHP